MSDDNKIKKRIYLKAELTLNSPLCISNGDGLNTDNDIIKDYYGIPFIPATSVVGAIRNYLDINRTKKLFGDSNSNDSKRCTSPITIYDLYFKDEKIIPSIRDGIRLDDNKITIDGAKFDYEIIEAGNKTELFEEVIIRYNDNENEIMQIIENIFYAIDYGDIRFGSKKNRGLGRFKIDKVYKKEYSKDGNSTWYEFVWNTDDMEKFNSWKQRQKEYDKYISLSLKLNLNSCISIRQYSTDWEEYDFEHITSNNIPIIPGSSWNGAFRHRAKEILNELGLNKNNIEIFLNKSFGFVDEDSKEAQASVIIFNESILEGSEEIVTTRNRINRFDASTINGALYTEKSYFGGTTSLDIQVRIDNFTDNEWIIGLLLLIIKDIENGFLAIGGQTSIGRGLFNKIGNVVISTSQPEEFYIDKLSEKCCQYSL